MTDGFKVEDLSPHSFGLLLTRQCPARCDHCVMNSSMKTKETIDLTTAENYIEAASICFRNSRAYKESRSVPTIAFSGGDPYVNPVMFKHLIEHAKECGMRSEGASSGFWGKNIDRARDYLRELQAAGLEHVGLSWDDAHAPHIEGKSILNILEVAAELSVKVTLNVLQYKNAVINTDNFWEKAGASAKKKHKLMTDGNIHVRNNYYCDVGRGKENDYLQVVGRMPYSMTDRCDFAITSPVMDWNGDFFCCCGFSNYDFDGSLETSPLKYANFVGKSVPEIVECYEELKHDILFLIMCLKGPGALLGEVVKDNPDLKPKEMVCGSCDICNTLFNRKDILECLPGTLERLHKEILEKQAVTW